MNKPTHSTRVLDDSTIVLEVTIPYSLILQNNELATIELSKTLKVEGFRPGKAPLEVAKSHLPKDKIVDEMLASYIPKIYSEISSHEKINAYITPSVKLVKAKEDEDWVVEFQIAPLPVVELPEYKKIIQKLKKDENKSGDKSAENPDEASGAESKKRDELANKILEALTSATKIKISHLIIQTEVNKRLASMFDEVRKLGLTVEEYAKSKGLSLDELRKQIEDEITEVYKLQFLLEMIANEEKITVPANSYEEILSKAKSDAEKASVEANRYVYETILKRNATLDFLISI